MTKKNMIRYKLTDQNMRTYEGYQWRLNKLHKTSGEGNLCGPGWLHFYSDPLLAVLLNPIHASIDNPRLFQAGVSGKHKDDNGLKEGWSEAKLIKELDVPVISLNQRIVFGILCAKKVCNDKDWNDWADKWLSREDRSRDAADYATACAADYTAAYYAADSVCCDDSASAADRAARAARAVKAKKLNLKKIAKEAMKYK